MTHTQREAALRLAESLRYFELDEHELIEAAALLRELAVEPHYTITWDAQGRRLVNGELAPEHQTAEPVQEPIDCGEAGHAEGRCGNASCCAKPVAWMGTDGVPRYVHPPQQRQPLGLDAIYEIWDQIDDPNGEDILVFARMLEAAHGIGGKE